MLALKSKTLLLLSFVAGGLFLAASTVEAQDVTFPACDVPVKRHGHGHGHGDGHGHAHEALDAEEETVYNQVFTTKAIGWAPNGIDQFKNKGGKNNKELLNLTMEKRQKKEVTDDNVFYVAPGLGSCGFNYTDDDLGVCLKPGWVNQANVNGCNKWVKAELPSLGTSVTARVLDSCGAVENSTFGCNDLYLTLSAYSALARGDKSIIDVGHLPGNVTWSFVKEPCFGCWAGLDGKLPSGEVDSCLGPDSDGNPRDGRKTGSAIKTGADLGDLCVKGSSAEPPVAAYDKFALFSDAVVKFGKGGKKH